MGSIVGFAVSLHVCCTPHDIWLVVYHLEKYKKCSKPPTRYGSVLSNSIQYAFVGYESNPFFPLVDYRKNMKNASSRSSSINIL
jgi:hypothetical protein